MKSLGISMAVLALTLTSSSAGADEKAPASITVAFGAGLNTAQPGNTPNHHVIPQEFTVRITKARKLDGTLVFVPATVNFVVSGFHWVWVYNAGVTLAQVKANIPPPAPSSITTSTCLPRASTRAPHPPSRMRR